MVGLFGGIYQVLDNAYPGEYHPWELSCIPIHYNDEETAKKATKWLLDDVLQCKTDNDFKSLKRSDFVKNGVTFALTYYGSVYNAVKAIYPNMKLFQVGRLNTIEEDILIENVRYYVEQVLGISNLEDLYHVDREVFFDKKVYSAVRYYNNSYRKMLQVVYPQLKPWLFDTGSTDNYFEDPKHRREAIHWLIYERLGLTDENCFEVSSVDFRNNKLERMFHDYYRNNLTALFVDYYGMTKEEYVKKLEVLTAKKVMKSSEIKHQSNFALPKLVFSQLIGSKVIVNDGKMTYESTIDNTTRLLGARKSYQNLDIKDGDTIRFQYVRTQNVMFIEKVKH